jgi:hypothetical protein
MKREKRISPFHGCNLELSAGWANRRAAYDRYRAGGQRIAAHARRLRR